MRVDWIRSSLPLLKMLLAVGDPATVTALVAPRLFCGAMQRTPGSSSSRSRTITSLNVQPQDFSAGRIGMSLPFRGFPTPDEGIAQEGDKDMEKDETKAETGSIVTKDPPLLLEKPPLEEESDLDKHWEEGIRLKVQEERELALKAAEQKLELDRKQVEDELIQMETMRNELQEEKKRQDLELQNQRQIYDKKAKEGREQLKTMQNEIKQIGDRKKALEEVQNEGANARKSAKEESDLAQKSNLETPPSPVAKPPIKQRPTANPMGPSEYLVQTGTAPLLGLPLIALAAGRAVLSDRKSKKQELNRQIEAAEARKRKVGGSSGTLIATLLGAAAISLAAIFLAIFRDSNIGSLF